MYRGFNEWLEAPWTVDPRGGEAAAVVELAERYPYFELAQVLAAAVGVWQRERVAASFAGRPYPALWLDPIEPLEPEAFSPTAPLFEPENEDLVAPFAVVSDELVSETFASILVNQGKFDQAKAMYAKLCLKNPEKSSYFASLMEQL